ncbi:SDR family oxidoreductase [Leeia oryzae]|uniref:SDR family oxidoreductase n=1 Tax=Leeia oryzae TaxID=356662 RepID=UPI00036AB5DE|nr:SDR family oxidoreductase [Leeia oryzae]
MHSHNKVLVLGATGGIGGEVARRLVKQGWTVTALTRRLPASDTQDGIRWKTGDAMNPQNVLDAAAGATWIVHAVNPPGYRDWEKLVLPMLDNTIAAARQTGARILLPGTVYNYGPDAFPLLDEQSPQQPQTKKGKLRVQMEQRLQAATAFGVQSLVVRAGDFFGPRVANSWFSQALIKPGQKISALTYPGQAGIGHQWAYLPDVAETMVRLMERHDQLADFDTFHMQGHWDPDGTALATAIARVTGNPALKVKSFPWFLMPVLALFKPTIKEMLELRYLWKTPLQMRNAKLVSLLGQEPHTPLDDAIRATLSGLGCL